MAAAPDIVAPQSPKAAARSLPRNTALTVDRVAGRTMAPPIPCTTRAISSGVTPSDRAANNEPTTKVVVPATNTRLRPNRSPIHPRSEEHTSELPSLGHLV